MLDRNGREPIASGSVASGPSSLRRRARGRSNMLADDRGEPSWRSSVASDDGPLYPASKLCP